MKNFVSALALFTCFAIGLNTAAAASGFLAKDRKFHLSHGVVASLQSVEVQRISSDNTIDIAIVLDRAGPPKHSSQDLIAELGEFCLRYQSKIVSAAVKPAERSKINLFAPFYQASTDQGSVTQQAGFGFTIRSGRCSLQPPFPQTMVKQTLQNAKLPVGQ